MLAPSPVAALPESAHAIIERHHLNDGTRAAQAKARFDQAQELRGQIYAKRDEFNNLVKGSDKSAPKVEAELARLESRLATLLATAEPAVMTGAKLEALLPRGVEFTTVPRDEFPPGENKFGSLVKVRAEIKSGKAERKAIANAPRHLDEVRAAARAQIEGLARAPKTLSMFQGGSIEFPAVRLPNKSPIIQYVPDGVALVCFLLKDELLKRIDELLEFNADPKTALTESEKAKRLAALDKRLEALGRKEASLVEAIVAEGGTAYHRADADILQVLGIAVA